MPDRTSLEAETTTSNTDRGLPCSRFSRRRRKMFSTSTTASSTSSPMAIARPPSVIVLIDRPSSLKMMAVVRIETGIAVSEMAVVRQLSRNANRTTATTRAASSSTRSTFWIESSMKFACRNMISSALTPDGRLGSSSASACVDLLRQRHRVDIGLLLDRDDDGGLAHIAGVAALDLRAQSRRSPPGAAGSGRSLDGGNDDVAQVFQAGRAPDIADQDIRGRSGR